MADTPQEGIDMNIVRTAAGAAIMAATGLLIAAGVTPSGSADSRPAAVEETTTTTAPAPVIVAPSISLAPAAAPTQPPASISLAKRPAPVVNQSGSYTCPGRMTSLNQYDTGPACAKTSVVDPGPNPDATKPQDTLAARDSAYQAQLNAQGCAHNPMWCDVDSSGHYINGATK